MSRVDAFERLLFAIFYLPAYYFVLYPVVFFAGLFVSLLSIVWTALTGRETGREGQKASRAWREISKPVAWVFSGDRSDKPGWVP